LSVASLFLSQPSFHAEGGGTGWQESFAKGILSILAHWGVSATSLMRIVVLLGDRVGDPLHATRMKIEISQFSMEILRFKIV